MCPGYLEKMQSIDVMSERILKHRLRIAAASWLAYIP